MIKLITVYLIKSANSIYAFIKSFSFKFSLFILLFGASCNNKNKKIEDSDLLNKSIIVLPEFSKLPTAEIDYYNKACNGWYDSVLGNSGFNGGIIVAKKGQIVFEAYNGTGHINGQDTITAATPFHIASVSKTFTAMAVLKLWQDGKLNIDDAFSKYFPSFNYAGVTIRSLLNHRSGLPNYVYFMETLGWDKSKFVSNEDVFNYLVSRKKEIKNIASPNTHFNYCNTNYSLLALLIEKISGLKYPAFLQETFFTPLQMKNTFVFDSSRLNTVNPSYDWRGRIIPFNFLDIVYGDKNIYSTVNDLLIWDRALSSGKIFAQKTLQEAYTGYSNEKNGIRNYGLGWRMNNYPNEKKMIYHNGWWHGNNASFIRLIEDSATIIVVGNKYNRGIYHAKDLAGLFGNFTGLKDEEEPGVLDSSSVILDSINKLQNKKIRLKHKKKRR